MGKNNNDSSESSSGNQDGLFYIVVVLLVVGMIYKALKPMIDKCFLFYTHYHGQIRTCLTAAVLSVLSIAAVVIWNRYIKRTEENYVTTKDEGSVYLGKDMKTGKDVYLRADIRTTHTQLNGTTNAGKTASVVFPWATNDIENGRGLIVIDGKSDRKFLDQLYAQVVRAGREKDFLMFSLGSPELSSTFNPFCQGSPEQITERVMSAFDFKDEYYKSIQFSALRTVIAVIMRQGQVPMPGVIRELLRNKEQLEGCCVGFPKPERPGDENLKRDVLAITKDEAKEFSKKYSGLVTALGHYSQGATAPLFNTKNPEIVLADVLKNKKICYFQLPTMQFPFLGQATGKLLLQNLQSTISELQGQGSGKLDKLFSIYLDDFNDYIYPGFVSLLNKSRSANIGVVFAHQSLGDLEKVSPDFKQTVMTNTNIKIVMRSNDPESAEHFAKIIGTKTTEKKTERSRKTFFRQEKTGDQSVRDTEEYIVHPNVFKSELGLGEGVVIIPHSRGRVVKRVKFRTVPELRVTSLPVKVHTQPDFSAEASLQGSEVVVFDKP